MKPRKEVMDFAELCEKKLRKNDYKPHWRGAALDYLRKRLSEEVNELRRAIDDNTSVETVRDECADVANFAMMIADTYEQR